MKILQCTWRRKIKNNEFISFYEIKVFAPSEDRTHDLEIMRLARCLLRYRGL